MEQRRRWLENRGGEKNDGDGVSTFKGRPGSKRKPRRRLFCASVKPRAATGATGSPEKHAGGDSCPRLLFNVFTELPFAKFHKLLQNLHNNSKISKNKSCSKSKVLQLCFYNHTQIRSTFWNANLNSKGNTLSTFCLFKLLQIFLNNFENSKNKLCLTWQALHFCF